MPQVSNMNKSKPATKPATKAPVVTVSTPTVETPATSLTETNKSVSALQRTAKDIRIPAFLQKVVLPETSDSSGVNYVGFCETQSKNFGAMTHAGLEPGDPFALIGGVYNKLNPLEFFLLEEGSFRVSMMGKEGKFAFVTEDLITPLSKLAEETGNQWALDAQPFYNTLLAVLVDGELFPIKADFKGTKADAGKISNLAVKEAASPDWIKKSNEHRVTAAVPEPFMRVWNSVSTHYRVGKSSGNDMYIAKCKSTPANVEQMELILKAFGDDTFLSRLDEAKKMYDTRHATLLRFVNEPEEYNPPVKGR